MAVFVGYVVYYYNSICWNSLLLIVYTQIVSEFFYTIYFETRSRWALFEVFSILIIIVLLPSSVFWARNAFIYLSLRSLAVLSNKIYISISGFPRFFTPYLVKICNQDQSAGNPTNSLDIDPIFEVPAHGPQKGGSVGGASGSSETTCVTSYSVGPSYEADKDQFAYWLAGLIDGDGTLQVSKDGHPSIEITLHEDDVKTLYKIKSFLGVGQVSKRSNVKAFRIRIHNKKGVATIINLINGKLLTSDKHKQLINICKVLDITPIINNTFSSDNAWFSGFFDAEGYITVRNKYTLTLSVSQKNKSILDKFKLEFNCGNIYYDKSWNGFNYCVQDSLYIFLNYFQRFPLLTLKNVDIVTFNRLLLFLDRKYHHLNSPYKNRIDNLILTFKNRKKI